MQWVLDITVPWDLRYWLLCRGHFFKGEIYGLWSNRVWEFDRYIGIAFLSVAVVAGFLCESLLVPLTRIFRPLCLYIATFEETLF